MKQPEPVKKTPKKTSRKQLVEKPDIKRNSKGQFDKGNQSRSGFDKHPENRSDGRWSKETSISYQYRRFLSMPIDEFRKYAKTPKDSRTVAEDLAYSRVVAAENSLVDTKEITDRTEGKARQAIDLPDEGNREPIVVQIINSREEAEETNEADYQPLSSLPDEDLRKIANGQSEILD